AAMYESGVLSLLEGNTNMAMSRFDTLAEKSPYDRYIDQAYVQMGMIRYRAKRYRDARHYFQLAARLYPDGPLNIEANRMMGECSMALNDYSNAQYGFAQVRKLGGRGSDLANAMFQEGVALYHLGRFKSSAERFTEYTQQFPQDSHAPEGYVWKGEALYQDGRYDEAERAYTEALRFDGNPKKEEATYGIAWTLFEQKKFSQAASAFDKFAAAYPSSSHVLDASLRKADSYFFMGQYDKATDLYTSLATLKGEPRTVEYAAFQLAMSYIQRGDADRGIDHLRDFLVKYPQSIYAEVVQFNIGWTYFSREQYRESIPEFHKIEYRYPQSQLMPRVYFNTGDAFFNLKSYDSSRVYYQRVIKEFPTSPLANDALAGLQYSYEAEGKPAQAAAEIDTLLSNNKSDGIPQEELILRKGDIYFSQGEFSSAVTEYQRVLTLKPSRATNAKALYQLGRSYDMQNNPTRAISYYQQILTNFSDAENAPAVSLALALAHIKTRQFRAALVDLHSFDARYPESPLSTEVHFQQGIAYMSIPEYPNAVTEFQTVIGKQPDNLFADKARLKIADIHFQKKEYARSIDTLNALVGRRSDDLAADGLVMIGNNHFALKKYRDALQAYNDVVQQYKEFPLQVEKAHFGLAKTYEKLNDRKQARSEYQKILESPVDQSIKYESEQRLKKLRK
ncbi:MAG TPA: tetratricopeptide repeat protein, partial [Bacteroidota bacterium]|nr:tetratricopeptide repeat protein [Bacteroidota bacterium]